MTLQWSAFAWLLDIAAVTFPRIEANQPHGVDAIECARHACIEIMLVCGKSTLTEPLECIFAVLTAWKFHADVVPQQFISKALKSTPAESAYGSLPEPLSKLQARGITHHQIDFAYLVEVLTELISQNKEQLGKDDMYWLQSALCTATDAWLWVLKHPSAK
ncbi:unnamed protein product [Durusdinium trenchii]|uniref:Uncharacterized protein n=1 Tax=Durusdinium trenchii TaxID=1381693 RepID=A0ABP0KPU9_9DINO